MIQAFFTKQAPIVARRLAEEFAAPAKAEKPDIGGDPYALDGWAELVPDIEAIFVRTTGDGASAALEQLQLHGGLTDQAHEDAAEWAKDRASELVGMKYDDEGNLVVNEDAEWAISDSTREALRADVTRAIDMGLSTDDFAAELVDSYAFSADRAEMIARTEIAAADIQGSLIGYRDSGEVSGKELLLGSEHEEPDDCDDAADMGVVPLEDDFGGLGDPPYHPNCVCDVIPVLASDDAPEGDED